MRIQHLAIDSLRPNPRNAHTHPKKQIDELAESIRRFGFVTPIIADETRTILAGHCRLQAAKEVGLTVVPVVQLENLSAAKKRALMLADNKIADHAGWDRHQLAVELSDLGDVLVAEGLDVSITGFAAPEIARITSVAAQDSSDPVDAIDSRWLSERPVSKRGDLWILGDQRILCGDAQNREALARLMREERAAMAFLDPFGHRDVVATGACLVQHLARALGAAASVSLDGAVHYVCCAPWRHVGQLLEAGQQVYGTALDLVVWIKSDDVGDGPIYSGQHELIAVFRVGQEAHLKMRRRRLRSNVWRLAAPDQSQTGLYARPVALIVDAMRVVTRKGDFVIDTFAGLGTTLIAAERAGRRCCALECQPRFVDTSIRRWQALTGRSATHFETGQSFDELARKRQDARAEVVDGGAQ